MAEPTSAERILDWGRPRLRDLPWRHTRDPWSILVAEVMLQQTQADRVIAKWQTFLTEWPTVDACAAATLGEVLRIWQGLGYPRRARNLRAAAVAVVAAGEFPSTLDGLLGLPGVGPYTARAVLAFAFERDVAIVDTNVARVLARVAGVKLTPREVQGAADALVPVGDGWVWNQTMLDLGAGLCRPRSPRCNECPIASVCEWRATGRPDPDPALGSAGVSGHQPRFEGSDRQGRGRLMRRLNDGVVRVAEVASALGWPTDVARADRVLSTLLRDGLVVERNGWLSLP